MATTRKKSLFSGGKRSISKTITENARQGLSEDMRRELLEKAAAAEEQRKIIPSVALKQTFSTISRRKIVSRTHDFSDVADPFPRHKFLLNQLLHGMILLNPAGVSAGSVADAASAIRSFLYFLNDPRSLSIYQVESVRDIDGVILRSFGSFLSHDEKYKKRASTLYPRLLSVCNELWRRYPDNPDVGIAPEPPDSPANSESGSVEGYTSEQLDPLIAACVKDIVAIKRFHRMYSGLGPETRQFQRGRRMQFQRGPRYAEDKFVTVLATLKHQYPSYPFGMPLEENKCFLSRGNPDPHVGVIKGAVDDCVTKISFMDGKLGKSAIFAAQHFTVDTIYPFFLLLLIHTGWNVESVATIPDDVESVVLENPLNVEEVIIFGRKVRSDKVVRRRSKKRSPFGPYGLLKYIEDVVRLQCETEHYMPGNLFQYVVGTFNHAARVINTFWENACRGGVQMRVSSDFLKRHNLCDLIGETVNHMKVRSGYATICETKGMTPEEIADELDHANSSTTIAHYLSDKTSNAVKDKIIASVQNLYVEDLRNYQVRIVTSTTLQDLRRAIDDAKDSFARKSAIKAAADLTGLPEKTVVQVMNPEADTYILVCEDGTRPTWRGHQDNVKNGLCRYFNKCCLCEQAIVFPEALPYIARRIHDLEKEQARMMTADWIAHYGEEYEAWESILSSWSDRGAVDAAIAAADSGAVVLPHVMRGLW
jgi:hypothetical protein